MSLPSVHPATLDELEAMGDDPPASWAPSPESLLDMAEDVKRSVTADLSRAERLSALLVSLVDRIGAPAPRARARSARAHVLACANRLPEAVELCEHAAEIASAHHCPFELAAARLSSVQPLSRLGKADDALAAAQQAAAEFTALAQPAWASKAEVNAGVIHKLRGNHVVALACFDRAAPSFRGIPGVLAQIESNRAEALLELNRFSEARVAFTRAADCFAQTGNRRGEAVVRGNLADLHQRLGAYSQALNDYEIAIRAYENDQSPGDLARLHAERAEVLAGLGMLRDAAFAFDQALPKLQESGLFWEHARATLAHARVLLRLRRHAECQVSLNQSEQAFQSLEHRAGLTQVSVTRALLGVQTGQPADVVHSLEHAAQAMRERPAESVMIRISLFSVMLALGSADDLAPQLETLVLDAQALGIAPLLADALRLRASAAMNRGNAPAALRDLREAMDLIERVRGSLRAHELRAAFLAERHGVYEEAVQAALTDHSHEAVSQAFEIVQRARARSFLDLLHESDRSAEPSESSPTAPDDHAPLLHEHAESRRELHALYAQLTTPRRVDSPADYATRLRRAIADAEQRSDSVELRIRTLSEYTDLYAAPCDVSQVRQNLAPRTILLDFFSMRGDLLVFILQSARPSEVVRLCPVEKIADLVSQFTFHIARELARSSMRATPRVGATGSAALAALRRLSESLLAPIQSHLRHCDHLRIVPHGPLHEVPFEALDFDGAPLIERFSCAYAPSASVLSTLASTLARSDAHDALVWAVPDDRAPQIAHEASGVAASLNTRAVIGSAATFDAFTHASRTAGIIHLAAHAIGSHDSPMSARLLFADRWVNARDIARLRLPGSLVVLSGCETGRGSVVGCDDVFGLVRAFVAAGARGLLVTRWPVHDSATSDLMIRAYERTSVRSPQLFESFAAALRESQRDAARAGATPAFWAPFALIGSP